MKHIILICSLMLVTPAIYPSYAQDDNTDAGGEETPPQDGSQSPGGGGEPVIVPQRPYEYYYWPEENLDNFGLSTLGQGQGGSTLGRSLNRKSNIEVNAPKKPAEEEDTKNGEAGEATDTELYPPDEPGLTDDSIFGAEPVPSPKESEFYEWVDEKGNVHITNNLGDVPPGQQEEVYRRRSSPRGE